MEVSDKPLNQFKSDSRKRHVEFHFECRCGQHHASDFGGVVVNPHCQQNAPHALSQNRDILHRDSVSAGYVLNECVDILHQRSERRAGIPFLQRPAVTARVPSEHGDIGQIQFIHYMLEPARVLMSPVK